MGEIASISKSAFIPWVLSFLKGSIGWLNGLEPVTKGDVCLLSSWFVLHGACKPYPVMIVNQVCHINLNFFIVSVAQMLYYSELSFLSIVLGSVFVSVLPIALVFIHIDSISDLFPPPPHPPVHFICVPNHSCLVPCQQQGDIQVEVCLENKALEQLQAYNFALRVWCYLNKAVFKQNCLLLHCMIKITLPSAAVIPSGPFNHHLRVVEKKDAQSTLVVIELSHVRYRKGSFWDLWELTIFVYTSENWQ